MSKQARGWLASLWFGFAFGCGVGIVSDDGWDTASSQAELSMEDCLAQNGFDAGFLGEDGGLGTFTGCADHHGHHGCGLDDGGLWLEHGDGGFPAGFGHHDGGWFHHHHHDGGFGFAFGDGGFGDHDCDGGMGGFGSHHHHDGGFGFGDDGGGNGGSAGGDDAGP